MFSTHLYQKDKRTLPGNQHTLKNVFLSLPLKAVFLTTQYSLSAFSFSLSLSLSFVLQSVIGSEIVPLK
jgi:hypothetical protein